LVEGREILSGITSSREALAGVRLEGRKKLWMKTKSLYRRISMQCLAASCALIPEIIIKRFGIFDPPF